MNRLPKTDLEIFPICLGGNVFGWTADRETSFAVLDAYAAAGGNFIDTADVYSAYHPGNVGGESETIIGDWMQSRGNRDQMVIATKVGMLDGVKGLGRDTIHRAAEASLERLQTDHIDLYYAHIDDPSTPLGKTMGAFDDLVRAGKVRYLGASNYSAERLDAALRIGEYVALQPLYNLVERDAFESELAEVAARWNLGVIPYYALAAGFLTGKYRGTPDDPQGARQRKAAKYLDERGMRVLRAVDHVADSHGCEPATVAIAWVLSRPNVVAPIASARIPDHLDAIVKAATLQLTDEERVLLETASA